MRDLLVEAGCRISIDCRQIGIQHDLLTANHIDSIADRVLVNDGGDRRILLLSGRRLFLGVHGVLLLLSSSV